MDLPRQERFLETAHPVKFLPVLDQSIANQIKTVINKTKVATQISTYEELKSFLLN